MADINVGYVAEANPVETMKTLLNDNWISYKYCPKPNMLVFNNDEDARSRINHQDGDWIIIKSSDSEQIKYRGNIRYHDKIYPMVLECYTMSGRQRIRDIGRMIKAICFEKRHNFTGYQLIRLQSYQELVNDTLNIWKSVVRLQVEAHGVISYGYTTEAFNSVC